MKNTKNNLMDLRLYLTALRPNLTD